MMAATRKRSWVTVKPVRIDAKQRLRRFDWKKLPGRELWPRPAVPNFDTEKDDVWFQLCGVEYYTEYDDMVAQRSSVRNSELKQEQALLAPIMRLTGETPHGNSITVFQHGFLPFFYVEALTDLPHIRRPMRTFQRQLEKQITQDIESRQASRSKWKTPLRPPYIKQVEELQRQSIDGYQLPDAKNGVVHASLLEDYTGCT